MTRGQKAQALQYAAAVATLIASLLADPEVRKFLSDHPVAVLSLLAAPSFVTILRALAKALRRGVPETVDPSEKDTNPLDVRGAP